MARSAGTPRSGPGHARPWPFVAALLAAASSFVVALGVAQKAHCLKVGWRSPDQFWHACYSDLPVTWQSSGLSRGITPYLGAAGERALDQPVVSGLAMWLVGLLVPEGGRSQQQWYFVLWALVVAVLVAVLVWVTAASARRMPWNAAHVAFSPLLVLVALVSTDLLGVVLASLALYAWGRRSVPVAGVLLGLAIGTRSYARSAADGARAARAALGPAARVRDAGGHRPGHAAGSHAALAARRQRGARALPRAWWSAGASYGSPWMVPMLFGHGLPRGAVTTLAVLGWVLALAVGAVLALTPQRRPAVAEVSLVMLAIVLVTGTTLTPQASLWLLPLVALVGLRWRDHLIWAGVEAAYFVAVWLYIAGHDDRRPRPAGAGLRWCFVAGAGGGGRLPRVRVWLPRLSRGAPRTPGDATSARPDAVDAVDEADDAGRPDGRSPRPLPRPPRLTPLQRLSVRRAERGDPLVLPVGGRVGRGRRRAVDSDFSPAPGCRYPS